MEEGEEVVTFEMETFSTSGAFGLLEEASKGGDVSEEKLERYKSMFTQMFQELKRTKDSDESLETQLGQLEKQLAEEKLKMESGRGIGEEGESTTLSSLREDMQQAKAEVALGLEREQVLLLEMNELQRQRDRLKLSVEALDIEKAKEIEPQVRDLRLQIAEIEEERDQELGKGDAARESLREINSKIKVLEDSLKKVEEEKSVQEVALSRIDSLPEKIRKQTELLNKSLDKLKTQESALVDKLSGIEKNADSNNEKLKFLNNDHFKINSQLEKSQMVQQQKERIVDLLRKELDTLEIESEQLMADKVKLDFELKGCKEESQNAVDSLNRKQKEKDKILRKFKKVEAQCKHVKASVPGLENQLEQIKHSIVLYESQIKKQQVQIGTIKKEIEASMDYYMQEESRGKEKTILFQQSYAEVVESEKELVLLKKEELQRERNIMELKNLKERVQHQVVSKMNKFKEAVEVAQLKDMIRADLKKKKKDTFRRLHEFQQLYELVKSQRNKFVNLIQASSQSIAEMKEKLKILSNELEILRTETMSKEKLLAKARLDRSTAQADREHVRTELNKCAFVFKQKQEVIEEQISEIDKLNSIISLTERDMLRLKRMYEVAVEARNHTGILLIDRNDELFILYEKANIQEEVIRQGEVVLTQKGNEIRSLNIEVKELRRSIDVKRKLAPEISLYDKQIVLHKQQLLEAKQQAVKLEKDLEDPNNNKRWRKLEGKIPDKEELNAKLKQLEDRLNDKREQLLEKTLILEEISSLSQRLKAQATGGRSETLELAKRVNDFQSRIRQITRKMMATVSELSMFQAQAMSLKEENTELKEIVQTAGENLENGIAPTEDAEKEWYRMENERIIVAEMSHRRKELDAMALDANKTLTTAIPRPNAYIPEDLGIPKPYGTSAPFKPTDPGATMRHIRKPLVREIQI
ncbi:coiled-coil domain-containing protein [Chloropicon roscoffensis]|uniref:Coiled-coil domain-containing protein n=1 Tax=Chloropicon roscoffensis TaxID=1461544 RepID=A0AAX4P7V2_9CHLO